MPELPEVETIRMQLSKHVVGQTVTAIESFHKKSLIGDPQNVIGRKITVVKRYGKMLVMELTGDYCIAIHLKMSGQLIMNAKPEKHTRVKIKFDNGEVLIFNDQRIFGWVKIITNYELSNTNYVKNLGPEPWDISDTDFFDKIKIRNRPIKLVILDQEIITGVGNIYANDALWEAKIDPRIKAKMIKPEDCQTLRSAIVKVLKEGIKYGGSTGADQKYVNLEGKPGKYQDHFRVYDRKGEKCLRNDGGEIQKISLGGRGTYFCPVCQK
jgi:formamidopyrimidine-DNA glycosylase